MRVRQRGVLTVVRIHRIQAASVVVARRDAGGYVSIDRSDQMKSAYMLIAEAQSTVRPELLLDLKATLLRVSILYVRVHGTEVEQDSRRQCQAAENVREDWRAGLCRRKTHADLAKAAGIGCITRREDRIRQRAEWNAIVEQPIATANHRLP